MQSEPSQLQNRMELKINCMTKLNIEVSVLEAGEVSDAGSNLCSLRAQLLHHLQRAPQRLVVSKEGLLH